MIKVNDFPTKCHTDIVKSINLIVELLKENKLNEPSQIKDCIQWFLSEKRFVIYAGAGTSKSINHIHEGHKYKSKNWRELLEELYERLDDKKGFLYSALARIGTIDCLDKKTIEDYDKEGQAWTEAYRQKESILVKEVLDKLGPVKFAWCMRWFFDEDLTPTNRDDQINAIVNIPDEREPETAESALLSALVSLPFAEIITTNYDQNLEIFLKKAKKRIYAVYDETSLIKNYSNTNARLFYLHGKAGSNGSLVFDKYDYAQLFSKNNQILQYLLTMLLRHRVLYIGFALDDQTFDYMLSQVRVSCDVMTIKNAKNRIPKSYSFNRSVEISKTEIKILKDLYNIEVVRVKDIINDLPKIIRNISDIIEYIKGLGIIWSDDKNVKETHEKVEDLKESATLKFLDMDLEESLRDYRKALAYTMFWTIEDEKEGSDETFWKDITIICELRRRLALTRSKLQWMQDADEDKQLNLIKNNINNATKLIENFESEYIKPDRTLNIQILDQLVVEKTAIKMLDGRIKYHEGNFLESYRIFQDFSLSSNAEKYSDALKLVKKIKNKLEQEDQFDKGVSLENHEISLLETYYFAQCQIDRATSIIHSRPNNVEMQEVARETEAIHKQLLKKNEQTSEYKLKIKEFGNVVVIAKWASAIGRFRNFSKFLVPANDAEKIDELKKIIKTLDEGSKYAKDNNCMPSPRWETLKYRYKSRALSLIWLNSKERNPKDLINSYTAIQEAIKLTSKKPVLRVNHIRNLLESVRLNSISTFGTFVEDSNTQRTPSISFAASFHFLENAFDEIKKLLPKSFRGVDNSPESINTLKENRYIWWLLIQAYETATFWNLVYEGFEQFRPNDFQNKWLIEFFREANEREKVEELYQQFGEIVLDDKNKVQNRIDSFHAVYEFAKAELSEHKPK